jgi:hypothetical protein
MPGNELEFLSWHQFHQMAPPIMQLEITRIGDLINRVGSDLEMRNALVKVRHELVQFIAAIEHCTDGRISETMKERLNSAIVNLPLDQVTPKGDIHESLRYILDRLRSIQTRIDYIYV